ncbi:MAG: zinc ribbon domain-containing protein [Lachnospiraceae bacterium]|nr:zinc ribbon domain-containing protein [Lachnospiraceae bacterium]
MKMIDLNCPKCGAPIEPDMEKGRCECKYCGHQMLIEKEDTLEEIAAKAQSKSYGYHKGKLQAEAEAGIVREGATVQKKAVSVLLIIVIVLIIIGVVTAMVSHLAKPKVNPFDYIEVSFRGTDGEGELVMKMVGKDEVDPNRIEYDVAKDSHLSQGDTISILATSSEYRLTEKSKTYVVEGLDEYLTDLADISAECLDLIDKKATAVQELNLENTKRLGIFVDMKPVKLFLLTDGERSNELYVIHEVNFATEEGNKTYYVSSGFEGVVIRKGAQISMGMEYGMYYGDIFTRVDSMVYITAYESVEQVRTELLTSQEQYMELKERDF